MFPRRDRRDRDTVGHFPNSPQLSHRVRLDSTLCSKPCSDPEPPNRTSRSIRPTRRNLDFHLRREHLRRLTHNSACQAFWVQDRYLRFATESRAPQELWSGRRFRCEKGLGEMYDNAPSDPQTEDPRTDLRNSKLRTRQTCRF
jgi:hypothetical protein